MRMLTMTILLCSIPSHYFMLSHPPTMLSDSQRVNWNENRVLVDSWKIMTFPIRVRFGNCSVVRLTCVVLVLFTASQGFHTHAQKHQHTHADLYLVAHTPVCTYTCSQAPPLRHTVSKLILKSPGKGRNSLQSSHHVCFFFLFKNWDPLLLFILFLSPHLALILSSCTLDGSNLCV